MLVKKKYMQRDDWKRITKKTFISKEFDEYVAGLINILEVESDLIVSYPLGKKTIVKKDYKWLELAYKNKNYFSTAMFNENNELLEIYFDINTGNYFEDTNNPYFYDMFIDVVLDNSGLIYLLDEDELLEAYNEKTISLEEYNQVIKDQNELIEYLTKNKEEVLEEYNKIFKILYNK